MGKCIKDQLGNTDVRSSVSGTGLLKVKEPKLIFPVKEEIQSTQLKELIFNGYQ